MKYLKLQLALAASLLLGALMTARSKAVEFVSGLRNSDLVACANTYDAAVETHGSVVQRTNDAAVTTRHLLWKKGAGDLTVALNTADGIPLGTIDNEEAGTGVRQSILLLGKGGTKKMVSVEAITAGEQVFAAANGKVQDLPTAAGTYFCVGTALTPTGNDNEILEVQDCVPFAVVVPE